MKLTLGFSPCPNDTFIFDAMIHGKIDTEGLSFEVRLADVEELNQRAFEGKLDITKLSYHAYGYLIEQYVLLDAGSALGNNCGPLLISKKEIPPQEVANCKIAIPGKYTTANLLLSLAFPEATQKTAVLFSEVEPAVLKEEFDAGLIIHENRFTYHQRGLKKIMDLGEFWEEKTKLPIPLGGIVANRNLPLAIQQKINRVLRRSVEFAFQNPDSSKAYIKEHAQEMEESVIYKHINLYVNDFTKNLGSKGKAAIYKLFETAKEKSIIPNYTLNIFINYNNK